MVDDVCGGLILSGAMPWRRYLPVAIVLAFLTAGCSALVVRPTDSGGSKFAKHSARLFMAVCTVGVSAFAQEDLDDQVAVAEGRMSPDMYAVRSRNRAILGSALIGAAAASSNNNRSYTCTPIGSGQYHCY